MRGVKDAFNQFIFEFDARDRAQSEVEKDLLKMLQLRYKNNAPRRPPRIVLLGPPGSGKSSQCQAVAETFGLVPISVQDLLKQELQKNPENGKVIQQCLDSGESVPDNIVNGLIESRLKQSDCRVNGWVMDGFPESET